ncbi:schwannomin-interacting protein 1 homolog [Musca vetustissima]|uniref:schwannomin-interacting protein 1 homolog n=1 Tax=Musca vetustissima TaxID=27455 RepID=UPI002AB672D3|nr:schwannomin-interacting protein 1 homolog [Musca vetustissima]
MRVPDISATAGYAANVFNPIGIQRDNTSTNSLISALGNEHNKFENISPTGTGHYYREPTTTNYASTADEFVQKALSSTPTEYSAAHGLNDNLSHYCCGEIPKNLSSLQSSDPIDECYDKEANTSGNTYKSFKEIFNTNKSFYEDCVRDFENINLLKNVADHVNDTGPGDVISSHENQNSNNECALYSSKNSFDNDFNQYSVTKCEHLEQQQNRCRTPPKGGQGMVDDCLQLPDDNDYDDHSMIDLCSETKSNYDSDEKDEEFVTSASSSTISLHTQKHSFFPRGIINPNYPGFQHLAHTLSEHFVTSSPSDSFESDMSEYDMDLSADSFDSLTEDRSQIELNNFNNNTTQSITMNPDGYPNHRHENFDYIHEEEGDLYLVDCDKGHRPSFDDDDEANRNRNSHQSDNNPFNLTDLQDGVQSKLTLLEAEHNNTTQKEQMPVSITPDILIKNHHHHQQMETQFKKENRPDLLRGVSPHSIKESLHQSEPPLTVDIHHQGHHGFNTRHAEMKDEMSFGLTPVDIIGDFGQEVEREFGLLVSGYRRLVDTQDNTLTIMEDGEKISDAALSQVKDQIDSSRYLEAFNKQSEENRRRSTVLPDLADDNAVDIPMPTQNEEDTPKQTTEDSSMEQQLSSSNPSETRRKPKYQKSSYDDRQLPPVAIEYKRCQQNSRSTKKPTNHNDKTTTTKIQKISHSKPSIASRILHPKRNGKHDKSDSSSNRKREEAELHKYQQLISDKEEILSNSKYAKLSSWAQHLKNSVKDRGSRNSTDLISPSALELFDAYKIGTEIDMEQLQQHLKMAKEIERQRRNDREEIRRRLAMGAEENCNDQQERLPWKSGTESRLQSDFSRITGMSSDTESHSSDSETCPKLSKSKTQYSIHNFGGTPVAVTSQVTDNSQLHPYHGRPLSISCSNNTINNNGSTGKQTQNTKEPDMPVIYSSEDLECDFFTKQAKLQIEARMALAQAKEMAHMQMEIERQNQSVSPITAIIRGSLEKVGVRMTADKRRVSRQMLTEMNIAQLQILVNSLHTHIEELNETLVNYLMERDDLHDSQDAMLVDIEELTRYIGAKEHIAQQERISALNKFTK